MKRIVVVIAVIIMLMGGGISVMKTLKIGPFAPVADANHEAAAAPAPAKKEDPVIVPLDPMMIPVFQGDRIATTVQLGIQVEALGKKNADKVKQILPKISDLFLKDLYSYLPRLVATEGSLDVETILGRLNSVAQKSPVTKDLVSHVLIQSISDTPPAQQ